MSSSVHLSATLADASRNVAERIVAVVQEAVAARGRCTIALAGGRTPETLYRLLASDFRGAIPWAHVHIFWSDERYVAASDPHSNYRMARRTLLDHVPCPADHVHPMPTHISPVTAAAANYEQTLRDHLGAVPRFDVMLLGVGADGHTASLFPHAGALDEQTRWVVATTSPAPPASRLSVTFGVINRAANTFVLTAGADKIAMVEQARLPQADPARYPVARLRESTGHVEWWLARVP
jgi:6-phosphogluconolactonase